MTTLVGAGRGDVGSTSPLRRRRPVVVLVALALAVLAAGLLSLALGSRALPLGTVVDVLLHDDGSESPAH
jgi:iron-siderophore transport system permease protein